MTRNVLKPAGSVRVAFAVAVGLPLLIVSNAFAQDPSAAPAAGAQAEVERVIVTGSNIPTAEEVGPNPVDTYRKDDIARLGVRSSTDLIQRLPAASGSVVNENNTNGGDGRAEINLRGILAKETLVLQDGRRVAPTGFAGQTADLNLFPVQLIDHVDILKDGASAIYGADAVAGVFNIWLIHRYRGLEIGAQYGNTNLGFANDSAEELGWILAGTGDDKTDLVFFAEWYNRAGIYSHDIDISASSREFATFGGADVRSGNLAGRVGALRFSGLFNAVAPRTYNYIPQKNHLSKHPSAHAYPNVQSDPEYESVAAFTKTGGGHTRETNSRVKQKRNLFNFNAITPAIAAVDREYFYGSFRRDICDKYLEAYADFKYARTFWDSGLAGAPFTPDVWADNGGLVNDHGSRLIGGHATGISATGISVPTQNPFNPFTVPDYTSNGQTPPGNPNTRASTPAAGTEFVTGVRYRALEAGLRTDKITTDNWVFTGGLKGNMGEFGDYLKTWNWEAGFRYNEDHRLERFGGIVDNNALRAALLDTNPTTAFDPFGLYQNNKQMRDRIFVVTNHNGQTQLEIEDFKVNGDLFNLPAGPLSFAVGAEHRREHASDNPDALTASGQTTGATNFAPTRGSRDVWSAFWEVRLPVTSPSWNFPGFYSLEFDYQQRYDNFSDFGDTERPKFSVRWQPLDSAMTIRATYSEAFHAPTLGELFSGVSQGFPNVVDPLSTATEPQVEQRASGNPDLKPETAYEWTYGAVVTPGKWWSALQGLTVSADFYHIDLRGITVTLDAQTLINNEAIFPTQIERDSSDNRILLLTTPFQNLGRYIQEGWDYELVYTFETGRLGHGDWGTLTTTFNGNYIDRAVVQFIPGGPEEVVVGKFGAGFGGVNGGGALTHNRWYGSVFYDGPAGSWLGGVDTGFTVHYIGQYWDNKLFTAGIGNTAYGGIVDPDAVGPDAFLGHKPAPVRDPVTGLPTGQFRLKQDLADRKVREWVTVDWILNYTFNFPAPVAQNEVAGLSKDGGKTMAHDGKEKNVMPVSTAEYNPCGWRAWLNNTTVTLGINNITDELPPYVAASFENGYDEGTHNAKGRFWYVGVKKKF